MSEIIEAKNINEARQHAAEDFVLFLQHAASLDGHVPMDFHNVMAGFLQGTRPQWRSKKKVIMGFRLAAKSWLVRQYVRWRMLRVPWTQVIIHSSSDKKATDQIRALHAELHKDPLTQHLAPPKNSGETAFNLRDHRPEQGESAVCAGINTSMTGSRCDLYWFDDPEPDTDPEGMHTRIHRTFREAEDILHSPRRHLRRMGWDKLPVPEQTQFIVTGQPHWEGTAYYPAGSEQEHPLFDALYLNIKALRPDDSWMWPYMMETKYYDYRHNRPMTVDEVKHVKGIRKWELEMMLNHDYALAAGAVIKVDQIRVCDEVPHNATIFVDPADGGDCEFGIVIAWLVGNRIHIGHMTGMHGDAYEGEIEDETISESVWNQIFILGDLYNARTIAIEKNLKAARTACHRFIRKARKRIDVIETYAKGSKKVRIPMGLDQPVNSGMVSFSQQAVSDRENMRQMSNLRWNDLPKLCDRIDALEQAVTHFIENPVLTRPDDGHFAQQRFRQAKPVGSFAGSGCSTTPTYI